MKMMKLFLPLFLLCLFGCQKESDPFTREMDRLADETQKLQPSYEEFEKKEGALPFDKKREIYATASDADRALQVFLEMPSESLDQKKIVGLIRLGIPEGADERAIFKDYLRVFRYKATYFIKMTRNLVASAKAYNWPVTKRRKLGIAILDRALSGEERGFIFLAIDIAMTSQMLKSGMLKGSPELEVKLNEIQRELKEESRKIPQGDLSLRLADVAVTKKVDAYLPSFVFRKAFKVLTSEAQSVARLREKFRPVFLQVAEINNFKP